MKKLLILIILLGSIGIASGQKKIKWMSWDEAIVKSKLEPKKVVVDIYTKWCGWCKKMDKSTFVDEFIVEFINENFYPVKFDAEFKDDITFNDKSYSFVKKGKRGFHELAVELAKGKLNLPTVVFLDETFDVLQPIPGFQNSKRFEIIITYFAGEHFKTTPWARYSRGYSRDTYGIPVGNDKN